MDEERDESLEIKQALKNKKKKMIIIIAVVALIVASIAGFFGVRHYSAQKAIKAAELEKLESTPLKDLPVAEGEEHSETVYSKDIEKQPYQTPRGESVSFGCTLIFYNEACSKAYDGVIERTTEKAKEGHGEGGSSKPTGETFGDKITKDILLDFFDNAPADHIASKKDVAENLKHAINERYKEEYHEEIVEEILVTTYLKF